MVQTALVTGACGLVGSAVTRRLLQEGWQVYGVDDGSRRRYFGEAGSVNAIRDSLLKIPGFTLFKWDVRDRHHLGIAFKWLVKQDPGLIVHAAAQPSHDWATAHPMEDFQVNAMATVGMLSLARKYCPATPFIFMSSIKVYGDHINNYPFTEYETRFDLPAYHQSYHGFWENMPMDYGARSMFGASKMAADAAVTEFGKLYGMRTVALRAGCITGIDHRGVPEHGMLSHIVRCAKEDKPLTINGYKGKQVRDQLLVEDLVDAIMLLKDGSEHGEAYNIGGGRVSSCSILEAIDAVQTATGKKIQYSFGPERKADHIWWITSSGKFMLRYPKWHKNRTYVEIIERLCQG